MKLKDIAALMILLAVAFAAADLLVSARAAGGGTSPQRTLIKSDFLATPLGQNGVVPFAVSLGDSNPPAHYTKAAG
jgi:hypothetical protein